MDNSPKVHLPVGTQLSHDQKSSAHCLSENQCCLILLRTARCSTLHPQPQCPFSLPELISNVSFALWYLYVLTVNLHTSKSRHHWNSPYPSVESSCTAAPGLCPPPVAPCGHSARSPCTQLIPKIQFFPLKPNCGRFPSSNQLWAMAGPPCPVYPEIKLIPRPGEPIPGGVQGWGARVVCRSSRRRHKRLL